MGKNAKQVGLGVEIAGIDTMMKQGNMQPTSNPLDCAIDGSGYFMVASGPADYIAANGVTVNADHTLTNTTKLQVSYTRDGAFQRGDKGELLTSDGYRILGYPMNDGTTQSIDNGVSGPVVNFVDNSTAKSGSIGNVSDKLVPLVIPKSVCIDPTDATKTSDITSFSINGDNGVVTAQLANGKTTAIGQIALAAFENPAGLTKLGKNLLQDSGNSGAPIISSGEGDTAYNRKGYGFYTSKHIRNV